MYDARRQDVDNALGDDCAGTRLHGSISANGMNCRCSSQSSLRLHGQQNGPDDPTTSNSSSTTDSPKTTTVLPSLTRTPDKDFVHESKLQKGSRGVEENKGLIPEARARDSCRPVLSTLGRNGSPALGEPGDVRGTKSPPPPGRTSPMLFEQRAVSDARRLRSRSVHGNSSRANDEARRYSSSKRGYSSAVDSHSKARRTRCRGNITWEQRDETVGRDRVFDDEIPEGFSAGESRERQDDFWPWTRDWAKGREVSSHLPDWARSSGNL